ncbi:Asp/Glu/hydantoin racemase [Desulfonispora thiosulfatigenes DSM 11270]|uniref:Asp/Glu/hydantoin racemase n=1 Tax=Desulfonispora thiosulfatigenes DSM 11270 TaxID=656914 RepID=A0A1W1UKH8_DESTI|nr:aspartate/glutamate racemase family protein [Desulfonispora thiosulfatigenes]SMB81552.1 Asp/Glu/hydantoin racemase [Desulfonispora thiosulfatigenes DSM 11270]
MNKNRVGIIRVLSTDNLQVLYSHETIIKNIYPELEIISEAIKDQPNGVYNQETELESVPKILEIAKDMEKSGVNAILISCCMDPGLTLIKKELNIPVVGAGMASALMAMSLGNKIGVTSLDKVIPPNLHETLGNKLLAYQPSEGINNTKDLLKIDGKEKVLKTARDLRDQGADCLLLACTGMSTIGLAPLLEEKLNIPVIDPIIASGGLINYLVKRK